MKYILNENDEAVININGKDIIIKKNEIFSRFCKINY